MDTNIRNSKTEIKKLIGTPYSIEQVTKQIFNIDTILLADFVVIPKKTKMIMDFGTGNGVILLYLSLKAKCDMIGIEIQDERLKQAIRNIELNDLDKQIKVINEDVKVISSKYKDVDVIVSNPPFFKTDKNSNLSLIEDELIARHEVLLTLEELATSVSKTLKFGGKFFMVHRPDRLVEIIEVLKRNRLIIKRIKLVYPYIDSKPNHVLIEAVKDAKDGLVIEKPFILYESKNKLTKEMKKIYGGI